MSTNENACLLARKDASDVTVLFDRMEKRLLGQLVHITVELLYRCEEVVGDMIITMAFDVFEPGPNWQIIDKSAEHANEIRVGLFLSQLLLRIIPVINNTVAV